MNVSSSPDVSTVLADLPGLGPVILPTWPAPPCVTALTTTRGSGCSRGPWASLNLAAHVGDDPRHVEANRELLRTALGLHSQPCWLDQVHGTTILRLDASTRAGQADGAYTSLPGVACAVLTADCLPVLLTTTSGSEVAAVHAGWRGLARGVIEAAVASFSTPPEHVLAWLGPAIGPAVYEVGPEVRDAFLEASAEHQEAFVASAGDRCLANLALLARQRLARLGVTQVSCGASCTYCEPTLLYSFRRDGTCGRMASVIFRREPPALSLTR